MSKYKYDGKKAFKIKDFDCGDTGEFNERHEAIKEFVSNLEEINEYQQRIFAEKKEGIIFVFQAMDAAGKDGAVRSVLSCLSPQGVSEHSFKKPSAEENAHDYLWRFWKALPEKGNISIFNRSYYEDVLVQRVHKFYMNGKFADRINKDDIIEQRYSQINNFEQYLWENSFRVIKIFLNVSKDEQARRFISRVDTPKKNWKFSSSDIEERAFWDNYMEAFEVCINKTANLHTPWYVVPADHKWYARLIISRIILEELKNMEPEWPVLDEEEMEKLESYKAKLVLETGLDNLVIDNESKGFKVRPADTAISNAINADSAAMKKKKINKRIKAYAFEVFKTRYGVSDEHLEELGMVYLNYEEMETAAEMENAEAINNTYEAKKKALKEMLGGRGKEARKLYGKFKEDAAKLGESYHDSINEYYNSYADDVNDIVEEYEKNVAEAGLKPEEALNIFDRSLRNTYNEHRAYADGLVKDVESNLNDIFVKYCDIIKALYDTKMKVDEFLTEGGAEDGEEPDDIEDITGIVGTEDIPKSILPEGDE